MKDVYCYAEVVPEIPTSQDSMDGPPFEWWHYENTTLHVPSASVAAYKAHKEWGQFKKSWLCNLFPAILFAEPEEANGYGYSCNHVTVSLFVIMKLVYKIESYPKDVGFAVT